jgi:hypothetical protein
LSFARKTIGKKPFIDYNQSHVIAFKEYSNFMEKAMEKKVVKEIKE